MTEMIVKSKPGEAAEVVAEAPANGQKRILLVEGDGFTRLVLLLRLRLAGFTVDFTSNGILGLGKLRSCHPDILLVELKLCGMSGVELIKAARAEPAFGNRPVYVFTHANRMNRATRKEVGSLATEIFDKGSITREDLVQIFSTKVGHGNSSGKEPARKAEGEVPAVEINEAVVSGAIEELISGVREQYEVFAREAEPRVASGGELLSRVSSVASCAKAAKLHDLARQSSALENFLNHLSRHEQGFVDGALANLGRAVEVMSRMSFESSGKQRGPTPFRVAFVDESNPSNTAMQEALHHATFDAACFEDPRKAREYLTSNRSDLIIANVVLPEGHGLAIADIRKLPLHAQTPVLFGPESSLVVPLRDELPISAPRFDRAPLLLSELIVRALNEVQTPANSASPQAVVASKVKAQPKPTTAKPALADALAAEDRFELFAQTPRKAEPPSVYLPVPRTSAAVNQARAFNHMFAAAGIPNEPIARAEPGAQPVDHAAEMPARLPEVPIDGSQVEEHAIEAVTPSNLQAEPTQAPEVEPLGEGRTVEESWVAPAVTDAGQEIRWNNGSLESEQIQTEPEQESGAATPNYSEVMNNQLHAESAEFVQAGVNQAGVVSNGHPGQREDLAARLCAAEMSLYHAHAEIEQRDKEIAALQSKLAGAGQTDNLPAGSLSQTDGEQKAKARCAELEEEVAALRQAFEGIDGSFGQQQQASAEAGKQLEELQQRLAQITAELEAQKELNRQLESKGTAKQNEAALQKAESRCADLEQELTKVRKANEELVNKHAHEPKTPGEVAASSNAGGTQEDQVRLGVAALAKATAELARERGERLRSQQLAADLNARLQALHADHGRTLQTQGEHLARINSLEQQHDQAREALERCTADLEQHQAERAELESQLQKTKEANAQLRKDLSFFDEANRKFDGSRQDLETRLQASLNAAREHDTRLHQEKDERQRLAKSLEEAQLELKNQSRMRQALEQQLRAAQEALNDREAQLQKEAAERQHLNETLQSVKHSVPEGAERDLEFSKLQSALQKEQIERKRQESQLARTRQNALDAALAARALRTSLRRQIREPVENLVHSARSLLEQEMGESQKKLVEAVLQDVLLVQTRLREPAHNSSDSSEPAASNSTAAA